MDELLRKSIISKLKECDAYIDNELPDYIMVMIANKKTMRQITVDLRLFLGENTENFMQWLQKVQSNPNLLKSNVTADDDMTPSLADQSPASLPKVGSKRSPSPVSDDQRPPTTKMSKIKKDEEDQEEDDDEIPKQEKVQRIKLPPEPRHHHTHTRHELGRTRDQDLRNLIRKRKAETNEEIEERKRGNMSSVVQIPERPKESRGGTSRLIQRAIHDIHGGGKSSKKRNNAEPPVARKLPSDKSSHNNEEVVQIESSDFVDEFLNENEKEEVEMIEETNEEVEVIEETNEEAEVIEETNEEVEHENSDNRSETQAEDNDVQPAVTSSATPEEIEAATLAAVKKVLPGNKTDLRQLLNRVKKKNETAEDIKTEENTTRFVVTMEGLDPAYEDNEFEDGDDSIRQNKMAERCKFWPNCKNGDTCPFHHPTVPCRLFPNCKYGQKCCFVHPVCKFDGRCMKLECPYLHTVPRTKNIPQSRIIPAFPRPSFMYGGPPGVIYGGGGGGGKGWNKMTRYPNKQSLKWTPMNERKFAVTESETTSMPV